MPEPVVLLIDHEPDGWYLIGHAADGAFSGDTWHRSLEEAQDQAASKYGIQRLDWRAMPDDVTDPISHALEQRDP
jgi:hypothetical protein